VDAGRRSGKTELAKRKVANKACAISKSRYFIAAPTRPQAQAIYWEDMIALLEPVIENISVTKLKITLMNKSIIQLFGLGGSTIKRKIIGRGGTGGAARIEGQPWHGGIIDEIANCPADVFEHNIRPALAEFGGWCWLIGVPEGRNHQYDFHLRGLSDAYPEWMTYNWPSADIIDPAEVEAARAEMDERMFRQEFEGSFESFEGLLYYNWEPSFVQALEIDGNQPLSLSCDFNKAPMVWDMYQFESRHGIEHVRAVDEISLPINAKTQQAADQFVNRFTDHHNKVVYVTGDASGNVESHRDWSTDYVIIRNSFKEAGWNVIMQVAKSNPSVNNRVNIGCSLMQHRRLLVDPKCRMLINDFERNESDGKGAKNKDDPQQTHASDNFDYLIWLKFSMKYYGRTVRQL